MNLLLKLIGGLLICTALVFDDNSVETFARQIFP